jgi:hypothetical protein
MAYPQKFIKTRFYNWPGSCSCPLMGEHTWTSAKEKSAEKRMCAWSAYEHLLSNPVYLTDLEIDLEDSFSREYMFLKCKKMLNFRPEFTKRMIQIIFTSHANKIWWRGPQEEEEDEEELEEEVEVIEEVEEAEVVEEKEEEVVK